MENRVEQGRQIELDCCFANDLYNAERPKEFRHEFVNPRVTHVDFFVFRYTMSLTAKVSARLLVSAYWR